MASLRPLAAAPAAAAADPKVPDVPGDLDDLLLVLIDLVLEVKLALTARARVRQPDEDLLIDMVRDAPVRLSAVVLAAAAPRPGRVLLRLALRKRRRLTLASAPRRLKLPAQPGVLGHQTLVLRAQPAIAMSAAQTLATTTRPPRTTSTPTLHTRKIPCAQQETCRHPRRPPRLRAALTQYLLFTTLSLIHISEPTRPY